MSNLQPPTPIVGDYKGVKTTPKTTQERFPWKAAIRTAIQAGIPTLFLIALTAILEETTKFITDLSPDSQIAGYAVAATAFVSGLSALNARIMATPAVNEFLTKIGLGAEPKNKEARG